MPKKTLSEENIRLQKLQKLVAAGQNPFMQSFFPTIKIVDLIVDQAKIHQINTTEIKIKGTIAGRIMAIRRFGKIIFMQLTDSSGEIQLLFNEKTSENVFIMAKSWDRGDIIGILAGKLIRSKTNELTILVENATLLVKALLPLPDKFHGLSDSELCYRKRYLDLLLNKTTKNRFIHRSKIITKIREHLSELSFLEVTTPILHKTLGGAAAKPFITNHRSLKTDFYLRVAPELFLKRLIIGGFDRVFEIGPVFRNEGLSPRHNPEFTILEVYQAYGDINTMIDLTENLFLLIADQIFSKRTFKHQNQTIVLQKPFIKKTMVNAVLEAIKIDFSTVTSFNEAKKLAEKHNISLGPFDTSVGHVLNVFFEKIVQPQLIQPTFIYEYPLEISPFAKKTANKTKFTDRFELFIGGNEYANAFSELNDPIDQQERLMKQLTERKLGNEEANELDLNYLHALAHGMPPTGGLGIGIDRMIMFFTNAQSIKDVIFFPTLKPEEKTTG